MTIVLNPAELKWLLIDSVKRYSENAAYISGNNPYEFIINRNRVYIFIRNIHDSGTGRANPDESRIQISTTDNFDEVNRSGVPMLFLGYDADNRVFTAWDPQYQRPRLNQRQNVSLYSRFSTQHRASNKGVAVYQDADGQKIISFQPEYVGLYIDNYQAMHRSSEEVLLQLIASSNAAPETEGDVGETVEIERQKFTVTHQAYPRDYNFTRLIRDIYADSCAMCGMQLELVAAAHIIPHGHPRGTDKLINGICLCILHHGAFDNGLIYLDSNYSIFKNEEKFRYLAKVDRDEGQERLLGGLYSRVRLPSLRTHYPSPENIALGNEIRGIHAR
jgi:putative restriction endonuclease